MTDTAVETIIEPTRGWLQLGLREIWNYRELLYFLAWRDVKVRYKQTFLGAVWAVLQPLMTMAVFLLIFNRVAKVPSDGVPYALFAFAGLLPWQLFAFALTESSNSLVANQNLIKKIYFPRLIIPLSVTLVGLVDFAISFGVLVVLMVVYGFYPGLSAVLLLPFLALSLLAALSIGIWFAALNIQYRDVRYVVPFLSQFWLYATPVGYPSGLIPNQWQDLYALNPMTGVVEGFRWALLRTPAPPIRMLLISTGVCLLLFCTGVVRFRYMEQRFADVA